MLPQIAEVIERYHPDGFWFDTMGAFQQEAKFDRVFSNSFFWVVTRSNDCFY